MVCSFLQCRRHASPENTGNRSSACWLSRSRRNRHPSVLCKAPRRQVGYFPGGDPRSPLERHGLPESIIDDDGDLPDTDGATDEKASPSAMRASYPTAVHFDNGDEHVESFHRSVSEVSSSSWSPLSSPSKSVAGKTNPVNSHGCRLWIERQPYYGPCHGPSARMLTNVTSLNISKGSPVKES
jgi:hypothetical protein